MEMWLRLVGYALVVCFVGLPGLILVHELGHATAAAMLTGKRVIVRLGREPARFTLAWGRIEIRLRPFAGSGFYQIVDWQDTRWQHRAWIALAGPAATMAVLVVAALLAGLFYRQEAAGGYLIAQGMVLLSVLQLALTVPPIRYPPWWGDYAGTGSDGRHAWLLWRQRTRAIP